MDDPVTAAVGKRTARAAYREEPDDPALLAAAIDEALFYSDEALARADEALALIEENARQQVHRRRERNLRVAASFVKFAAGRRHVALRRGRALLSISRVRTRESHRGRPGHARRATATSGTPPGGDDPPGSSPPRLTLAPSPGAVYTFGVEARERWGLA